MTIKTKSKLGRYLEDKGIRQSWLAEKLGLSEMSVSRYCSGVREPSNEKWILIAKYLEVPVDRIK